MAKKKTQTTAAKKKIGTSQTTGNAGATKKTTTTGSGAMKKTTTVHSPAARPQTQVEMKITHEMIARRAYEIWLAKGRPAGQEEQNWREAEAELRRRAGR